MQKTDLRFSLPLRTIDLFVSQLDTVNALLFQPEISHLPIEILTVLSDKSWGIPAIGLRVLLSSYW